MNEEIIKLLERGKIKRFIRDTLITNQDRAYKTDELIELYLENFNLDLSNIDSIKFLRRALDFFKNAFLFGKYNNANVPSIKKLVYASIKELRDELKDAHFTNENVEYIINAKYGNQKGYRWISSYNFKNSIDIQSLIDQTFSEVDSRKVRLDKEKETLQIFFEKIISNISDIKEKEKLKQKLYAYVK